MFYLEGSAHLSQSDFQLLFPYLCRRFFHARAEGPKVMELNVRSGVEFLRNVNVKVKAEKDGIFTDDIEGWVELEKDA
jgi:platelet-activating factor acetylhydrolase